MKNHILIIIFLIITGITYGQVNLIPNGGFDANPNQFSGGSDPTVYYTAGDNCITGNNRFEADMTDWFVAETNASWGNNQNPISRKCSPDWIAPWTLDSQSECLQYHTSFFCASAFNKESIMTEMVGGYTLVKGKTYKFQAKVRAGMGSGSFQVVFSTKQKGLNVSNINRWNAVDVYVNFTNCEWKSIEYYFTVPNDDDKKYEEMKYLVLQYNNDVDNNDFLMHYDDIYLVEEEPCLDHKKIQDWQYFDEHKIVQANVKISAGANVYQMVDPSSTYPQKPVIVRSSAMVIYRAPTIYLEPGFFVEEPGSYFETQVGTCVEDPCPQLPALNSPITAQALCGPKTLDYGLPDNIPGVFYSWTPSQYFSAPWSNKTDFIPPSGNGCIDAKLTVWSICGASQVYNFPVKYYEPSVPQASISNIQITQSTIKFTVDFDNVQIWSVVVTDLASGEIIYQNDRTVACGTNLTSTTVSLNACDFDMCGDKEIKVIAGNGCFDPVETSFIAPSPVGVAPTLNVTNVQNDDFQFSFDVAVNANTEYVIVELWNEDLTTLECTKTYRSCDIGGNSLISWDNSMCEEGCVSVCGNHKIKIKYKNICANQILEETLDWIKTNDEIEVADYPNVVTANDDGINDELCLNVTGADHYSIFVVDRWGITRYSHEDCVTSNPVCIWSPESYMPEDVYFYTVEFTNSCGSDPIENTAPLQIYNDFGFKNGTADTTNSDSDNIDRNSEQNVIQVFPNPVDEFLYIFSSEKVVKVNIFDVKGRMILNENDNTKIDCTSFVAGTYFVEIHTADAVERIKFIKK